MRQAPQIVIENPTITAGVIFHQMNAAENSHQASSEGRGHLCRISLTLKNGAVYVDPSGPVELLASSQPSGGPVNAAGCAWFATFVKSDTGKYYLDFPRLPFKSILHDGRTCYYVSVTGAGAATAAQTCAAYED